MAVTDEHDLVDEEDARRRKLILWISLGAAALIAIILLLWLFMRDSGPEEPTTQTATIPDVVGMEEDEARAALEDLGFLVEVEQESSTEIDEGLVTRTDPPVGEELTWTEDAQAQAMTLAMAATATAEATGPPTVTLFVSAGPDAVTVPSVRGMTQEDARTRIEEAGLTVGSVEQEDDPDLEQDRVTKTDPEESTEVASGTAITLYVSSGQVELPDVTGGTEDEARATLRELGLIPDVNDVEDDSVAPGTVLSQSPSPGRVPQGSTVQLDVAVAPSTVIVPDVTGLGQAEAERQLGTQGLSFTYGQEQYDDNVPAGSVISQNPNGGTEVAPDTQVTLVLSRGPQPQPSVTPSP